ncbi:uncharacterized protein FIBRA_09090 [Fibroporia radiculosa]|uniref:Uncharacterized protein n=1 Tax=Fibroporia radiculosa TaxID=599839 RepID=J4GXX2_9APHY|nr:uncharacterized protein FIBRA_09090 [Fibroporia radiculosa]CCM06790.1 predicted protein [Fibroporia radiculosa]
MAPRVSPRQRCGMSTSAKGLHHPTWERKRWISDKTSFPLHSLSFPPSFRPRLAETPYSTLDDVAHRTCHRVAQHPGDPHATPDGRKTRLGHEQFSLVRR